MEAQKVTKCNRLIGTNLHHDISVLILNLSEPLFLRGGGFLKSVQEAKNANNSKIF
jgi:hypothetical protein